MRITHYNRDWPWSLAHFVGHDITPVQAVKDSLSWAQVDSPKGPACVLVSVADGHVTVHASWHMDYTRSTIDALTTLSITHQLEDA